MSALEMGLIAVVGYFIFKSYQRKKAVHSMEDLGGGLPTTDIESYNPPSVRLRPVVIAKPTGLEGNQILSVPAYKDPASLSVHKATAVDPTSPEFTSLFTGSGASGGTVRG